MPRILTAEMEQRYLDEIKVLRKASKIQTRRVLQQYEKVTENIEAFNNINKRNELILDSLSDLVIVIDNERNIVIWNRSVVSIFNIPESQAVGKNFRNVVHKTFPELSDWFDSLQDSKGKQKSIKILSWDDRYFICKHDNVLINGIYHYILVLEESTEIIKLQKLLEEEKSNLECRVHERTMELQMEIEQKNKAHNKLEKMAHTDMLTGLPNRQGFLRELNNVTERSKFETSYKFSVFFIDLDGFKAVNDGFGHQYGDKVLCEVSRRLSSLLRGSDLCARLAGDEFVILLNNPGSNEVVHRIAHSVLQSLAEPVSLDNSQHVSISGSIGIYMHDGTDMEISQILSMADQAMYEAKRRGKNCIVRFNDSMLQSLQESSSLINKISSAFDNDEFHIHFQPVCDINGYIKSVEALARWTHQGEDISPEKFISLLEQRGLINKFTLYMIRKVFDTLIKNTNIPAIAVNLSIQQFYDDSFIEYLDYLFSKHKYLRKRIIFEITESLLNNDRQLVDAKISQLRERGFSISIDDFGTGYSSFSYIRTFNADSVKIDREFVKDIDKSESALKLLKGIIALMQSLEMDIVIEGVETSKQFEKIRAISNRVYIQGYYLYKPMPVSDLLELLRFDATSSTCN